MAIDLKILTHNKIIFINVDVMLYLDGVGGIQHILQTEVTAIVKVFSAELLDQLKIVQTVSQ